MRTRREQMTSGGIDNYSNFIGNDTEYQDWRIIPYSTMATAQNCKRLKPLKYGKIASAKRSGLNI